MRKGEPGPAGTWKLVGLLVAIAGLSLLGAWAVSLLPAESLRDLPLHSVCEAVSGLACVILGVLLLLVRRSAPPLYSCLLFPASGLLGTGVLDLFHACVGVTDAFVWLRVCASAAGGLGFALLALPRRIHRSRPAERVPAVFFGGALVVGVLSVASPRLVPRMLVDEDQLAGLASAIGVVSGSLFLLGCVTIATGRSALPRPEVGIFASFCLLQALADYLFAASHLWAPGWWWWHLLIVVAALVLLAHALRLYARLQAELTEALAARDRFLSLAAHDLKTPLSAIRINAQLLLDRAKQGVERPAGTPDIRSLAEKLVRQLDRALALVNELLDVAKIRAGKLVLQVESVDMADIVTRTVEALEPVLSRARCPVKVELAQGVRGDWDPMRISQVVSNLLTNAGKFGARKPIEVRLARVDGRARLTVHDAGIGVAKEDQARIFERFERAVSGSAYPGLGLGLYISREIVEAHGGRIGVESEPGHGSTFFVELPCERTEVAH
jgi:signal transduction histidine kinase